MIFKGGHGYLGIPTRIVIHGVSENFKDLGAVCSAGRPSICHFRGISRPELIHGVVGTMVGCPSRHVYPCGARQWDRHNNRQRLNYRRHNTLITSRYGHVELETSQHLLHNTVTWRGPCHSRYSEVRSLTPWQISHRYISFPMALRSCWVKTPRSKNTGRS